MRKPGVGDRRGHAPDRGRGFVLGDELAVVLADQLRAEQAVRAHAGEEDGEDAGAVSGDGGAEKAGRRRGGSDFPVGF